jgi:hypothetical protein
MKLRSRQITLLATGSIMFTTVPGMPAHADPAAIELRQEFPDPPIGAAADGLSLVGHGGAANDTVPFRIGLDYHCADAEAKRQLLLTVADTAQLIEASGLPSPQTLQIDVPLAQLQWLRPAKACAGLEEAVPYWAGDGVRYFRLRTRATAFVTLTCTGASGSTEMSTATAPLDVWLGCDMQPALDSAPAELSAPGSDPGN